MEEAVNHGGELAISIVAALLVIGAVLLLLSRADTGLLRAYVAMCLEAAC